MWIWCKSILFVAFSVFFIKLIPRGMPVAFDIPRISSLYSCGIFSNKAGFNKKQVKRLNITFKVLYKRSGKNQSTYVMIIGVHLNFV